jgi:hypothetical protein
VISEFLADTVDESLTTGIVSIRIFTILVELTVVVEARLTGVVIDMFDSNPSICENRMRIDSPHIMPRSQRERALL